MNNNIENVSNPILNKQKICRAYYPYPEYKLKILINSLLKKHNLSIYSHNITNKIWYELVEEMGEPS